jgi:hypothetical protein
LFIERRIDFARHRHWHLGGDGCVTDGTRHAVAFGSVKPPPNIVRDCESGRCPRFASDFNGRFRVEDHQSVDLSRRKLDPR